MHFKPISFALIIFGLTAPFLTAQGVGDPVSGRWFGNWGPTPSHRHAVVLELKWDGKTLKGTINPGPNSFKLQKALFDPSTGGLHMEVEAGSMGHRLQYIIEAKVEDGLMFGTWHHTKLQGDFRLSKK
jgi:hypothetical protein